jgi:Ca-activated chloride channel homolog
LQGVGRIKFGEHLLVRGRLAIGCGLLVWASLSFSITEPSFAQGKKGKSAEPARRTTPTPTPTPIPPVAKQQVPSVDYKLNVPVIPPPVSRETNSATQPPVKPGAQPEKKSGKQPEKEPENSGDTFRINSNLVAVPVSVTDAHGEPMRQLRAEDFQLEEEGQTQQLQSLGEPGKTPLELALLFDLSGSVRERFEFQRMAATRFLKEVLKPTDSVTVFSIGFDPKLVGERTSNLEKVLASLNALQPSKEGTAFFDTVAKAAKYLSENAAPGSRRVVLVISDGEDNHSETYRLADTQRELQRTDTLFYAINPSGPSIKLNRISMRGHNGMATLAAETGGVAFLPDQDAELEKVFRQIAAELQAQYLLGYYSSNETNDGKFRRIKIQLPKRPDLRIRARQGYYAPKD